MRSARVVALKLAAWLERRQRGTRDINEEQIGTFLRTRKQQGLLRRGDRHTLAGLLHQVAADVQQVNRSVKDLYPRRRPPLVDPAVQPCVEIPKSNSYPSGHSVTTSALYLTIAIIAGRYVQHSGARAAIFLAVSVVD